MNIKFLKGFVCFLLVVITSFMFAGCEQKNSSPPQRQNQINYSTMELSSGEINDIVSATLFEDSQNFQTELKKNQLINSTIGILNENYLNFINQMETSRNLYQLQGDEEMASIYNELLNSVKISEPHWENNTFYCSISYKSKTARALFYNSTESDFTQGKTKTNLFTQKLYFDGNLNNILNSSLYSLVYPSLQTYFEEFKHNNFELTYSYLAPAKRYHSNANYQSTLDDGYMHTWVVDQQNTNQNIYFYLVLANRSSFYILAIIISLLLTIVLLLIALIIKKIKNINKI